MYRKTFIAATLAAIAFAAAQPASAGPESWANGASLNGLGSGAGVAKIIAIELPREAPAAE